MAKKIVEYIPPGVPQILEGSEGTGKVRFTALVQRAETYNSNRRRYPSEELRREFTKLNGRIQEAYGHVDHPLDGSGSVSGIGIKWLRFFEDGNQWFGEGETVPTSKGRDLQAVIEAGLPIGFSSRAFGDFEEEVGPDGQKYKVVKNLELVTIDAVTRPSVGDARLLGYTREDEEDLDVDELQKAQAAFAEAVKAKEAAEARLVEQSSELEGLRAQVATAEQGLAEANSANEKLRSELSEAQARVAAFEAENARGILAGKLDELVGDHRFKATILAECEALGVTIETYERIVPRVIALVEAAGAKANESDDGEPRGDMETDEDKPSEELSEAEKAELKAAGLL